AEHFLHNRVASVATLRWCSGSSRNGARNHPRFSVRLRRNPHIANRRDMSAMLDVVGRPVTFSCFVVTLIEERVERFQDKRFVFRFNRLTHLCSPSASVKFLSPIGTTCQTRLSEY